MPLNRLEVASWAVARRLHAVRRPADTPEIIDDTQGASFLRGHHDMGGLSAGPVERSEHDYAHWEKRVDALMVLLSAPERRLLRVDELRRNIEGLGPDAYDAMSYYERWIASITKTLLERGVISSDELGRKIEAVKVREAKP
jgi:nitrile hydratase subunit beta